MAEPVADETVAGATIPKDKPPAEVIPPKAEPEAESAAEDDASEQNVIATLQLTRPRIIDISSSDSSNVDNDGRCCPPWVGTAVDCTLYACQFLLLFFFIGVVVYGLSYLIYHIHQPWM